MTEEQNSAGSPPAGPSSSMSRGAFVAVLSLALLAALALVYGPTFFGDYVYDDLRLIVNNPRLTSVEGVLEGLRTPHWSFDEPEAAGQLGHWRPLTVLFLAIGHWIGLGTVMGHHLLSLLLHLAAGLATARLVGRMTGSRAFAAAAALLFSLHPVQVEAVAWASAINDPLYALFAILGLDAWIAWRGKGSPGLPLATSFYLLLSVLAKEQGLVLPLLLVAYDLVVHLVPARRDADTQDLPLPRSYVPIMVVLAVYVGMRMFVFGSWTAGFDRTAVDFPLTAVRQGTYRVEVLGGFFSLLAWPADLAVFRGFRPQLPDGDLTLWIAGAWIAVYGAIFVAIWSAGSRTVRALAVLLPLTLVPQLANLELVGAYPLSDRYLYLTVALFCALLVLGVRRFLPAKAGLITLTLVGAAWATRAHVHARVFEDNEAFSIAAVEDNPRVPAVYWQRGNLLLSRYQTEEDPELVQEAFVHFLQSLALGTDYGARGPRVAAGAPVDERLADMQRMVMDTPASERRADPTVFVSGFDRLNANLGQGFCYLYLSGVSSEHDLSMAMTVFEEVSRLFPRSDLAQLGLGLAYKLRGDLPAAEVALGNAANLNKLNPDAWHELGDVLYRQGKWEGARNAFQRALHLRPEDVRDRLAIVKCALEEGRHDLAATRLEEARSLAPGGLEVLFWSGMLAAREGSYPDALAWFERALAVDERFGLAHLEKARVLLHLGENAQAVRSLGRACELMPSNFEAHYNLGSLLDSAGETEGARRYLIQAYGLSDADQYRDLLHMRLAEILADDPEATLGMANVAQRNRDHEAALDWVERAIERSEPMSRNARAHYLRGRYLQLMTRNEEAAAALRQSLLLKEDDFWTQHDLGLLLAVHMGRFQEARPHLERALELVEGLTLDQPGLQDAVRENLTAALEGRRPEMGPTLAPIEAAGVEER